MEDGASSSALSKPGTGSESSDNSMKQAHVNSPSISAPSASSVPGFPDIVSQINHVMYPTLVPGLVSIQNQNQPNHGAGVYALPVMPFMGHMVAVSPNTLIPLTYNIPLRTNPGEVERTSEGQGQGQEARQQAQQRQVVVRRFQIGIQIDLLLILKLAAVIFVFHQEGSKQRLIVLVCFATIIYLYQTGALAPLVRWITENMHRNALPPQPHHPARVERDQPVQQEGETMPHPDLVAENINQPMENANQAAQIQPEQGAVGGINWWGIAKEIQLLVVGFLSSLLPGFHPHHD